MYKRQVGNHLHIHLDAGLGFKIGYDLVGKNAVKMIDETRLSGHESDGNTFGGSIASFGARPVSYTHLSNSKYRRTIWQCNGKFKGVEKCRTPHLYEDDIKAMFLKAVSELMIDREALIDDGRVLHTAFTDFNAIDKEVAEITSEIDVLSGLVQKLVDENASTTLDQTEYRSRYDGYIDRYDKAKKRLAALQEPVSYTHLA